VLNRNYRIQSEQNVTRVYRRGQGSRAGQFGLKYAPNQLDRSRLAVVVSKKISKSAPVRNRIRRRLYERFRDHWDKIIPGYDMVLNVYAADTVDLPVADLDRLVAELLTRAKLYNG
jgi:ribonuclease P protein component